MVSKIVVLIILISALTSGSCERSDRKAITCGSVPQCGKDMLVASPTCNQHKTAVDLIVSGQYEDAEEKIREIIVADPDFFGAYRTLGEILPAYIGTGTMEEFLNKLKEQQPANGYVYWALGLLSAKQGNYKAALEYFRQTISLKPGFYDACENLVDIYGRQGKLQEERPALETFFSDLRDKHSADGEYGLAYLNFRLGELEEAFDLCMQLRTKPLTQSAGRLYKLTGILYSVRRQSNSAIACYECALNTFRDYGDIQGEMAALINLGTACDQLLDYEKALEQYRQALPFARLLRNSFYEGVLLMNSGIAYQNLDDYSKSFLYYQQALDHFRAMGAAANVNMIAINSNMGVLYEALADYSRAFEYYESALELSRAIQHKKYEIDVLNNLGEVYKKRGDYDAGLDYYDQALGLLQDAGQAGAWTRAVILNNTGEIYASTGRYGEAMKAYNQSLENRRQTGDRRGEGITVKNIGHLYYREGDYSRALGYYREALQSAGRDSADSAEITGEMGICYRALKQYNRAFQYLENSIEVTERLRNRLRYEKHKTGFMQNKKRIYDAMVELLYTKQHNDRSGREDHKAFMYSEKAKARTLLNLLEENRVEIKKGISPELAESKAEIDRMYSLKSTQLQEELEKTAKQADKTLLNKLAKELNGLEKEYEDVLTRAALENPGYEQMFYSQPVSVAQIQEILPDASTLLISYQVTEKALFAWCIRKGDYTFLRLPTGQITLQEKVLYLYHLLSRPSGDGEYLAAASELYTLLVKPVLPPDSHYNRLIIIPDGILHYLPFEALVSAEQQAGATPAYLVREYNIQYVQSASILYYLFTRKNSGTASNRPQHADSGEAALLAVGDPVLNAGAQNTALPGFYVDTLFRLQGLKPMPFSSREVQEIGRLFPRNLVLRREDALEERIKQPGSLDSYAYIHFATHSIINEESPGSSGLVLTQDADPREDGFLQVREIFNLETRADLVVLSACSTMLGEYVAGEGMIGLTRAWMYAGAAAVVASLWNVQDESTAAFMSAFYGNLKAGLSGAAALRQARLLLMEQDRYRHPYYWAGFVLTGKS